MFIKSPDFEDGAPIPARFALCKPGSSGPVDMSDNKNPGLTWGQEPQGTHSFALTFVDSCAPTVGDDVNKEGCSVPASLPRDVFVHWLMADVPIEVRELAAGACSDGVASGGKSDPGGPAGACQGVNDYTSWFAQDPQMRGTYCGYDGPAPPWNDELVHRYQFTLYALDLRRLELVPEFTLAQLQASMRGHVLAEASLTGTYTLNRALASDA